MPSPCPQSLSLLSPPPPQAPLTVPWSVRMTSKDLLMSLVYSLQASCWAQASTGYEELQAQSLVNQLLSERNLSWVPPASPSFLPPSSHLSDLHASEVSAQPSLLLKLANMFKTLWQRLYFLKTWKWKKQTNLLFLSLSKKNNPLRRVCTLSILIHWTVRTYRSKNLVKDWRCVALQITEEPPKI